MATLTVSVSGGNWNSVGTWDEGIVPSSTDDVVVRADGLSGSVTVTATASCATLNLDTALGYGGTFTINSVIRLTVSTSIVLNNAGACTGISGAGLLTLSGSLSLTSNGKTITARIEHVVANAILTLVDSAIFTGLFTTTNGGATVTITSSGATLTCSGGITATGRTLTLTNTTIKITGGTLTGTSDSAYGTTGTGTFEFAGAVTCAATGPLLRCANVIFTSGYSISGGSLSMGGNITVTGTISLPTTDFRYRNAGTLTLSGPFSCGANFNVVGVTLTTTGAQTVTLSGTVTASLSPSGITPGNCTWVITAPVTIQTAATLGFTESFTLEGGVTIQGSGALSVSAGKTLTVETAFTAQGWNGATPSVVSRTPSSLFTLALDPAAVVRSTFGVYTDATVTGQTINNAFGSTTRTTGVVNKVNSEMVSVDPGVGNVIFDTAYTIDGAALTGTFIGKSSSGSIS